MSEGERELQPRAMPGDERGSVPGRSSAGRGSLGEAAVIRVGRGSASIESGPSGESESSSEAETDWPDNGSFRRCMDMVGGREGGQGGEVVFFFVGLKFSRSILAITVPWDVG